MKFIPTDEQWAKMKKHIKSDEYKKENFFVFETLAVGDRIVPQRYIKIMPDLLQTMKEDAEKGVSLMLNHNWGQFGVQSIPLGKVFDARLGEGTQEGETTALYTTQYILRDDSKVDGYSKNDIIKLIETGILADTSIGWGTESEAYKCNICGHSIYDWRNCKHIPGNKYIVDEETNEVKQCIIEAHTPREKHAGNNVLMENSIVFDGAYPNAIIQSRIDKNLENKGDMLKTLEGKQEMSENSIIIGYTTNGNINLLYKDLQEKGGTETMANVEGDETEVVGNDTVDTVDTVDTEAEVTEQENIEQATEQVSETETVDSVDNSVDNTVDNSNDNTENMHKESELLEKFGNISDSIEGLIQLAKEGLENRNEVISQALESGVRSMGNAFNKEVFTKTFSSMQTKDIKEMANTWEKQVNQQFSTNRVSKDSIEMNVYDNSDNIDYSKCKTDNY